MCPGKRAPWICCHVLFNKQFVDELNIFMIKRLGNYKELIEGNFLQVIKEAPGLRRPGDFGPESITKDKIASMWNDAGYDFNKIGWWIYFEKFFESKPNFPVEWNVIDWWFVKLSPGDLFPMHIDAFEGDPPNIKRWWMACEDYQPGHVFIYEGKMLDEYRAGDLFEFNNPHAWHAAANLSFVPKISLQIVCSQ